MTMIRYPLPITPAMLAPANVHIAKPRYDTAADWSQGATGNEEDIATGSVPVVDASNGGTVTPYPYRTQAARAAAMGRPIGDDIGKDYGIYAGGAGRTGPIGPRTPYPDATSPPFVASVNPNTGGVAGGTNITISGAGLTGATGVTFGGTAATAVTVVDSNTITCASPVKTAGQYDVVVTTPRGTSATGIKFTYA